MQVLPSTAKRFGATTPDDPAQNVNASARYLPYLVTKHKGDMRLVLAAYNAGEGAVDYYHGVSPYAETKNYVRRGMALWRRAA
jgi:soluble lytic murein transglycosylase-like protein